MVHVAPATAGHLARTSRPTRDPLIIGHQGTNADACPNTMGAFRRAARWADVIETDIQVTADGVLVVYHDKTLDSGTSGSGAVAEQTYRQLRRCRMADGSRIPSFGQLLRWLRRTRLTVVAEMKLDGWSAAQAATYSRLIRRWGMLDRTIASSFDPGNLAHLRSVDPEITRALVYSRTVPSIDGIRASGAISMPWFKNTSADDVSALQAAGLQVWCWTARSASQYRRAAELGVDGIVADDPEALRRWLSANGDVISRPAVPSVGSRPLCALATLTFSLTRSPRFGCAAAIRAGLLVRSEDSVGRSATRRSPTSVG